MESLETTVGALFDAAYVVEDQAAMDLALERLRTLSRRRLELLELYGYGVYGYAPSRDGRNRPANRPFGYETTSTAR